MTPAAQRPPKGCAGTHTEIACGPTGAKLALMTGQTLKKAFVRLPAGATAVYNSSGLEYYRHADWLVSARLFSTPSRTVSGDTSYSPFGAPYAGSGTVAASFTGKNQDTASSLYDFPEREYGQMEARWPSPDPLDTGAFNLSNPQSLNRYSYVLNNPESFVDPLGLKCVTLGDGTQGDDGTLPKCNDPSVWTSETVDVNGGGGETPSELYQLLWEAEYGLQPTMPPLVYARLPFGGGPRPVGPNKPQTEVPIWVLQAEDVFSQAASNFVNEFKKGGCVADFIDRAAGFPGPAPVGPQPADVVAAAGAGLAWRYAADNTLIVPLRSSIYAIHTSGNSVGSRSGSLAI